MKRILAGALALCLTAVLALPASALEYAIPAPDGPDYGTPTSVERIHTADGGARENEDVSKNAALIPPGFGTASADALGTGMPLTLNLAPDFLPDAGSAVRGSDSAVVTPGVSSDTVFSPPVLRFTEVTSGLYDEDGSLGTLRIPSIGVTVPVCEGTDSGALSRGAGHFEGTSIWDGNVALAGHNRGAHGIFGRLHTLEPGAELTLTTSLGTRRYQVVSVEKVEERDTSGLAPTADDRLTLYTCVRDQPEYRWQVVAAAV